MSHYHIHSFISYRPPKYDRYGRREVGEIGGEAGEIGCICANTINNPIEGRAENFIWARSRRDGSLVRQLNLIAQVKQFLRYLDKLFPLR